MDFNSVTTAKRNMDRRVRRPSMETSFVVFICFPSGTFSSKLYTSVWSVQVFSDNLHPSSIHIQVFGPGYSKWNISIETSNLIIIRLLKYDMKQRIVLPSGCILIVSDWISSPNHWMPWGNAWIKVFGLHMTIQWLRKDSQWLNTTSQSLHHNLH